MIPRSATLPPFAASSVALYLASTTPVSGTALVLTGTKPDVPRQVLATYGNEAQARTLVLGGTDRYGNAITETLFIPSGAGGTVGTVQQFASLTSALPLGGGWTTNLQLGTSSIVATEWVEVDTFSAPFNLAIGVVFANGAAGTVEIEYTYDDPNQMEVQGVLSGLEAPPITPYYFTHAVLVGLAQSTDGFFAYPILYWRLASTARVTVNSIRAVAVQAGQNI